MCSRLDEHLEELYGARFSLHPNRLKHGTGANPSFDGLFATSASFTLGYGSEFGKGYLVNVEIRTLDFIPSDVREDIMREAFSFIQSVLPVFFTDRKLSVVRDGRLLKIIGDFSLGNL